MSDFGSFAGGLSQGVGQFAQDLRQERGRQQNFEFNRQFQEQAQQFRGVQADLDRSSREAQFQKSFGLQKSSGEICPKLAAAFLRISLS